MRVTQRSMYNSMLGDMQSTLSAYMESVTQGASEKKLNRPSDDPAGAARVLSYRASLTQTNQHVTNAGNAEGWLSGADEALIQAQTVLSKIRGLASQGSNGIYDADQRMNIAKEVRQHMGTLMNLANNKYEGKYLFSGEKYDRAPYQEGLATTIKNPGKLEGATAPNLPNPDTQVTGTLPRSAQVRFAADATIPPEAGSEPLEYQWSTDGGKTWTVGTIKEGQNYFDVGSARVTVPNQPPYENNSMSVKQGYKLTPGDPTATPPVADKRSDPMFYTAGTTLEVRPTMIYQGSDNAGTPTVTRYGTIPISPSIRLSATGSFSNDTLIRFDDEVEMTDEMLNAQPPTTFPFSYSTDGGITWITGNKAAVTQDWSTTQPADVSPNTATGGVSISSSVKGGDVKVRVDNNPDLNDPTAQVQYSYSTDGGTTWITGTPTSPTPVYGQPNSTPGADFPPDLKVETGNMSQNAKVSFPTDGPLIAGSTVDITVGGVTTSATFAADAKGNLVAKAGTPPDDVTLTLPNTKTATMKSGATGELNMTANHTKNTAAVPVPGGTVDFSAAPGAPTPLTPGSEYNVAAQGSSSARLVLPGGFVDVKIGDRNNGDSTIPKGAQLNLQPQRTSLDFEILENQTISVNNIGKDIFGGLYRPKGSENLEAAAGKENGANLFENLGRLIAACENNDSDAIAAEFDIINESEKNVLYHTADIGGKKNRISSTLDVLEGLKIDQTTRMSAIEDVDFTELMTRLSQQQTAYSTVLKSSSMIMQLNLMKFM